MEIIKYIKYTLAVLVFFLYSCTTSSKMVREAEDMSNEIIEETIERATVRISDQLKKKGKYSKDNKYYYRVVTADKRSGDDPCQIFHNNDGYDVIKENVVVVHDDYYVVAMVVDDNDDFIIRVSMGFVDIQPEQLNIYPRELKMIELAKENDYIAFIEIFSCQESFMIGYKKGKVDVYRYTDDDVIFLYSK